MTELEAWGTIILAVIALGVMGIMVVLYAGGDPDS